MTSAANQSSPLQGMEERPEWSFRRDKRGAVSFFRAPASSIFPYKDITLADIYHYITGPYAKSRTEQLRRMLHSPLAPNEVYGERGRGKGAAAFKRTRFDYVTFSGTFTRRTDADLVAHSGYLCLDFDHLDETPVPDGPRVITPCGRLEEVRRLLADPHFETLLLFTSPSGNGLKWVIPIGNDQLPITPPSGGGAGGEAHRVWFYAVRNYLAATYHLDADPACVNVSRSCFLPHDPDCYIAPRLLPELVALDAEIGTEGALTDLATVLGATNIQIPVNNPGDAIAAQNPTNNESAE